MKFTVSSPAGKVYEFEATFETHLMEVRERELRLVTTAFLWRGGRLLSTGVAVKHPDDPLCYEGERLAFKRALSRAHTHPIPHQIIKVAWKRATSKAWQEANGKA